jgi:hypothetical protein
MSVLNPKEDAAALQPVLEATVKAAVDDAASTLVPALQTAVSSALAGLTINVQITILRREESNHALSANDANQAPPSSSSRSNRS